MVQPAGARPSNRQVAARSQIALLAAFHLALLAVTLAPVLSVDFLALADLPNHLARLHVLANIDHDPDLQANYEVVPSLTPYLLVDWMLTPLVGTWSVYEIGRWFVAATMAVTYCGILLLSAALWGRLTFWPAVALPVLYNYTFSWGFLNYCFGVSVMFIALAIWFRLSSLPGWWRGFLLLGLSATLYLTHMLVFGQFAAIVGAHTLSVAWHRGGPRVSALAREFAPVLPPLILTLAAYAGWSANDGMSGVRATIYGGFSDKLPVILSPTFFSNSIADVMLFAFMLVGGLRLAVRGSITLADGMALPLLAMALLCVLMPNTLLGVWGVDFRLPPVLVMLLIAATQLATLDSSRVRLIASLLIAGLVLARVITVWQPIATGDRQFAEFRDATAEISRGARVIVTLDEGERALALPARAYWHVAQLAVIERSAFVPFLFTGATQIRASARNRELDTGSGHPLTTAELELGLDPDFVARFRNAELDAYHRVYWADWPDEFDYLVQIDPIDRGGHIGTKLKNVRLFSYFYIATIERRE